MHKSKIYKKHVDCTTQAVVVKLTSQEF